MYLGEAKMLKVEDDWYPCYPGGLIKCMCFLISDVDVEEKEIPYALVKLYLTGLDDYALEKYYRFMVFTREEALGYYEEMLQEYHLLKEDKVYSKAYFLERGFQPV